MRGPFKSPPPRHISNCGMVSQLFRGKIYECFERKIGRVEFLSERMAYAREVNGCCHGVEVYLEKAANESATKHETTKRDFWGWLDRLRS